MNGDSSHMIAEIKTAIEKGTLTHSEIERRLEAAVTAEIEKTDSPANMEMVRACQSLLWELDTHGKETFEDDTERALAAFKARQTKHTDAKGKAFRFTARAVSVAAAVLLIFFGVDALFHREWLEGKPSQDEQQYIIDGRGIDPGLVNEGVADDNTTQPQTITTTNLDEAIAVLGYTPLMPSWVPDGWTVESYYARKASTTQFRIMYQNIYNEFMLRFSIAEYPDVDRATTEFEQEKSGNEEHYGNWIVYITENVDRCIAVWQDGTTCYSLSGPISLEDTRKILNSIITRSE